MTRKWGLSPDRDVKLMPIGEPPLMFWQEVKARPKRIPGETFLTGVLRRRRVLVSFGTFYRDQGKFGLQTPRFFSLQLAHFLNVSFGDG